MNLTVMINNMAAASHRMFFWNTPYDTGNLARSVGSVGMLGGGVGFIMFNQNQKAPYGALLNEQEVITVKRINTTTGKVSEWSYNNRHFGWVDKAIENTIIPNLCTMFNLRREL